MYFEFALTNDQLNDMSTSRNDTTIRTTPIDLPIPEEIAYLFSSDDYADLLCSTLSPIDMLSNWGPNCNGSFESLLYGFGPSPAFVEITSQHWEAALLYYLIVGSAATYNLYLQHKEKKISQQNKLSCYQKLRQQLGLTNEKKQLTLDPESIKAKQDKFIIQINKALENTIKQDRFYKNRYNRIELYRQSEPSTETASIRIRYHFQQDPSLQDNEIKKPSRIRIIINKIISPLYSTAGLSAFMYWAFFLATSIATGSFAEAGIAGVSTWLAFGIPLLVALPYPILKIRNWIKNKGHKSDEGARLTKIAKNDTPYLMKHALYDVEYLQDIQSLENEYQQLSNDQSLSIPRDIQTLEPNNNSFGAQPTVKAASTLYTSIIYEYTMTQYTSWIISDFIKLTPTIALAIPFFGEIMGGLLIAVSVSLGIVEMIKRYREAKTEFITDGPKDQKPLLTVFTEKAEQLESLKMKLQDSMKQNQLLPPVLRRKIPSPPAAMSFGRMVYTFFDWQNTGIYFAKIFFRVGAAIILPFAAASLSNPVTLTILILSGFAYLAVKAYQAYQKKKEMEAKEMVDKIKDMDDQIHVAKLMQINIDKKNQLSQKIKLEQVQNVKSQSKIDNIFHHNNSPIIQTESKMEIVSCPKII